MVVTALLFFLRFSVVASLARGHKLRRPDLTYSTYCELALPRLELNCSGFLQKKQWHGPPTSTICKSAQKNEALQSKDHIGGLPSNGQLRI